MAEKFNPENIPKFKIPEDFLKQIAEFTDGGFLLFTINEEQRVVAHWMFENEVSQLALIKCAEDFSIRIKGNDDEE